MISVEEFMQFHVACPKGRKWALAECPTMNEVWKKAKGEWLIWVVTRPGVATPKEKRLLAVHAARSVAHLLKSPDSLRAIEVAERHAYGLATDDELAAASAAAWDAAAAAWDAVAAAWDAAAAERAAEGAAEVAAERDAERAAERAVEGAAERAAAGAADRAAERAAERAAAWAAQAAAWDVAWAARDAASAAAWEGFAQWARSNIKPDFTRLGSRDE